MNERSAKLFLRPRILFIYNNFKKSTVENQSEAPEGAVALCIADYSLGNLLWLKNPTRAPDLPEKLLIADTFAAIQPSDALWKAYLIEIARLQEQGQISSEEYYALRLSLTAKRTLMDLTAGNEAAFSEGTVAEVLKVSKETLRADLQAEIEQERRRRESAETTTAKLEQRDSDRRERVAAQAKQVARIVARTVCAFLLILLTLGTILAFPWSLPKLKDAWYRYLTTALLAVFFVYTLASILWGTSVSSIARALEKWLFRSVHRWLSKVTGYT